MEIQKEQDKKDAEKLKLKKYTDNSLFLTD
jgi:hypothetical protein